MALKRKTAFPVSEEEKDNGKQEPQLVTKKKPLKKGWKTWQVFHIDSPNDYEYVDAKTEKDAIARSSFEDKDDLFANEKPEKNCFIIDVKNGSYETFIEDKKIHEEIPNARIWDFEGKFMYYLYREYKADGTSRLVGYSRPEKVLISPDTLNDAIHWTPPLLKILKTSSMFSMENLSKSLILGVLGLLIFLVIILMR